MAALLVVGIWSRPTGQCGSWKVTLQWSMRRRCLFQCWRSGVMDTWLYHFPAGPGPGCQGSRQVRQVAARMWAGDTARASICGTTRKGEVLVAPGIEGPVFFFLVQACLQTFNEFPQPLSAASGRAELATLVTYQLWNGGTLNFYLGRRYDITSLPGLPG